MVQLVETALKAEPWRMLPPFISHSPTSPATSRHRISLLPSPLKSWVCARGSLPRALAPATAIDAAHGEAAPPELLCVKRIAGKVPCLAAGGGAKLRLFVSPVKPWPRHEGAFNVPLFTLVRTTRVDPLLKLACDEQQSPTMLNSAAVQPCARKSMLSGFW